MEDTTSLIHEADRLQKSLKSDQLFSDNDVSRHWQQLQDVYSKLLIYDLEAALDRKLEQDLWNFVFKNVITDWQNRLSSKQLPNGQKTIISAQFKLLLDASTGFYLKLLYNLIIQFDMDLPFVRHSTNFGSIKHCLPKRRAEDQPRRLSSLYICQYCLVHIGDICRYRCDFDEAVHYYNLAVRLIPSNGQPYNQLAIVCNARSNQLGAVFYYARSVAVKCPFPPAIKNIEQYYGNILKQSLSSVPVNGNTDSSQVDLSTRLASDKLALVAFLQFHAAIYLKRNFDRMDSLLGTMKEYLAVYVSHILAQATYSASTPTEIIEQPSSKLVQMVVVSLFSIWHVAKHLGGPGSDSDMYAGMKIDDRPLWQLLIEHTAFLLEVSLQSLPKMSNHGGAGAAWSLLGHGSLPAIKLLLEWLLADEALLKGHAAFFKQCSFWFNLRKLLNAIQQKSPLNLLAALPVVGGDQQSIATDATSQPSLDSGLRSDACLLSEAFYEKLPLPEDYAVFGLLPFAKIYAGKLDFSWKNDTTRRLVSPEQLMWLRARRVVRYGKLICEQYQEQNYLTCSMNERQDMLQFNAPLHRVKLNVAASGDTSVGAGVSGSPAAARRSTAGSKNVAIQAILKNRTSASSGLAGPTNVAEVAMAPMDGGGAKAAPLQKTATALSTIPVPDNLKSSIFATVGAFGEQPPDPPPMPLLVDLDLDARSLADDRLATAGASQRRTALPSNLPPRMQAQRAKQLSKNVGMTTIAKPSNADCVDPAIAKLPESAIVDSLFSEMTDSGNFTPEEREYLQQAVKELNGSIQGPVAQTTGDKSNAPGSDNNMQLLHSWPASIPHDLPPKVPAVQPLFPVPFAPPTSLDLPTPSHIPPPHFLALGHNHPDAPTPFHIHPFHHQPPVPHMPYSQQPTRFVSSVFPQPDAGLMPNRYFPLDPVPQSSAFGPSQRVGPFMDATMPVSSSVLPAALRQLPIGTTPGSNMAAVGGVTLPGENTITRSVLGVAGGSDTIGRADNHSAMDMSIADALRGRQRPQFVPSLFPSAMDRLPSHATASPLRPPGPALNMTLGASLGAAARPPHTNARGLLGDYPAPESLFPESSSILISNMQSNQLAAQPTHHLNAQGQYSLFNSRWSAVDLTRNAGKPVESAMSIGSRGGATSTIDAMFGGASADSVGEHHDAVTLAMLQQSGSSPQLLSLGTQPPSLPGIPWQRSGSTLGQLLKDQLSANISTPDRAGKPA